MLSETNTKVGGRLGLKRCGPSSRCARGASAVFKTFVLHPKNTFATIGTNRTSSDVRSSVAIGGKRTWCAQPNSVENDPKATRHVKLRAYFYGIENLPDK
jgi:hypothetical protein